MGGALNGVHYLRSALDADAMRPDMKPDTKLIVIGGGYIGLEVAAIAAQMGMEVTVVEMAERILQRVAAPETSDYFRALHQANGVNIIEATGLAELVEKNGTISKAILSNGDELKADMVLAGIGIVPVSDLAERAGLDLENGICVDEFCRTSDENIYAAGDCASFDYRGERIRLESVPNAIHQAETAAANMLGENARYEAKPWFWSDQYDVKLQIAGLNSGYDATVVRPGKRDGGRSVWYFGGGCHVRRSGVYAGTANT